MSPVPDLQRRCASRIIASLPSILAFMLVQPNRSLAAEQYQISKQIPSTNEAIAPIGMGTWITFNVGRDPAVRAQRARVLQAFF
ncbi:MAG: aldo/keto reductase, partial [Burkholderiaceae bacterium]